MNTQPDISITTSTPPPTLQSAPSKISLIGMPSSGKSNVGMMLAGKLGRKFMDLDRMVEHREGQSLISILETKGGEYFLNIENEFLHNIQPDEKVVISTAGSIIYHAEAIEWLKSNTIVVLLDTPFETIEARLAKKPKAVVGLKEKGLVKLWEERMPVYRNLANITVQTSGKSMEYIVAEILASLG
ncbi:MAG: shikimate kinase [Patescibacteria group bacterium]